MSHEHRSRASRTERVAISVTGDERAALRALAADRSEPEATAAGRLVRAGLENAGAVLGAAPRLRRAPNGAEPSTALWLPTDRRAAAVLGLLARYPSDLGAIPDHATDRLVAEQLAALSVWRDSIDAGQRPDPREEVAFGDVVMRLGPALAQRRRRR